MRKLFVALTLALGVWQAAAQTMELRISNPCGTQRHEVIEADCNAILKLLNTNADNGIVVKNDYGQEQTYQISHNGKLLLYVDVQPHSTATYHISKGKSKPFKKWVEGRVYPQRADDLTWENDLGIYRMYGPALQRAGEKAFGTDVWVKNTPEPVVAERYRQHSLGVAQRDSLRRLKQDEAANAIYMSTSFHHDHGYGLDCYAVGQSLGCGAPALMKDGQLVFPYCWRECKILDNGPLRFTAELTYNTSADGITEHRLVSLDKGSHFNRMTVWYDGIQTPTTLAAGVVLHDNEHNHIVLGDNYVLYADPTENPRVNQSQIFVAALFPNSVVQTIRLEGKPGHALGTISHYKGERYTYYFGSAWSKYDIHTQAQWQLHIEETLQNLKNPLSVNLHY